MKSPVEIANELAAAVRVLSRHRLDATILVDPAVPIAGGALLEAVVSREILVALAVPESLNELRAGAVIVRGCRIERAGVPVSWEDVVERAAEFAAGTAIAVDDAGEVRIMDRTGRVDVVQVDELTTRLRRRSLPS